MRAFFRLTSIVALLVASACSGPSAPSSPAQSKTPVSAAESTVMPPQPGTPAAAAASGGFEFLGSDPGPGAEMSVTASATGPSLGNLVARLTVHFNQTLATGRVRFELLDEAGRTCAGTFVDRPITAGHVHPVATTAGLGWREDLCVNLPVTTVALKATLLTQSGPSQTDYLIQTFPVRYTLRRYPPPPPNPPQAPPQISSLTWNTIDPVAGAPAPGDVVLFQCTATETDGAPVTVRLTQRWDGLAPIVHTKVFEAGASSSPSGARFAWGVSTPNSAPVPRATLECVVTNDRGQHAVRTINMGPPR